MIIISGKRLAILGVLFLPFSLQASDIAYDTATIYSPGESAKLADNLITQELINSQSLTTEAISQIGKIVFMTPFNRMDGFGDGPMNHADTTSAGGRPTLQNNSTFLRINGLDTQSCADCHNMLSTTTIPPEFAIGGAGTAIQNAMGGATSIDVADTTGNGFAAYNGRFINPPFMFGSGGVELLAKEMTAELQQLKARAQNNPGTVVSLVSKGVDFGTISYDSAADSFIANVEGVDSDLVIKPFGRKGEFISTRDFDVGALAFHFGMQPVETVGQDVDADNDGVFNEVTVGEVSALSIFTTNMPAPRAEALDRTAVAGAAHFDDIGCSGCHRPFLDSDSTVLSYSFPEVASDPAANVYWQSDLSSLFAVNNNGGIRVPMFADLKRHYMGEALAESTGNELAAFFTTARLWGVADTEPYMHDGRALTISEAILMHGGDAQAASDNFASLDDASKIAVLTFLRTLRTPTAETLAGTTSVETLSETTSLEIQAETGPGKTKRKSR